MCRFPLNECQFSESAIIWFMSWKKARNSVMESWLRIACFEHFYVYPKHCARHNRGKQKYETL